MKAPSRDLGLAASLRLLFKSLGAFPSGTFMCFWGLFVLSCLGT